MTSIIIVGHGTFASGISSMLTLVMGECPNMYFVDFTQDLTSKNLEDKFNELYKKTNGDILFLCDIAGGTPFNQAAMLMHKNNKKYNVLGGLSIPLILDILDRRESVSDCKILLEESRKAAYESMNIFGETKDEQINISDDGI